MAVGEEHALLITMQSYKLASYTHTHTQTIYLFFFFFIHYSLHILILAMHFSSSHKIYNYSLTKNNSYIEGSTITRGHSFKVKKLQINIVCIKMCKLDCSSLVVIVKTQMYIISYNMGDWN